jgi:hypothetical protein
MIELRSSSAMQGRIVHLLLNSMNLWLERERKPWLDTNSVLPGEKWKQVVSAEIKKSRFFIALISKNSVKRGYVQKELKEALEILDEFPESGVFIIPVRLEAINISDSRLEQIQYVDLFPSWGEASKRY